MNNSSISLWTAVLININLMIGAGIYFMPPLMAKAAGNLSYLGWPIIGLLFLPVVLSIAAVAKKFPQEGSFYVYAEQGLNRFFGFLSGWTYCLGWVGIGALQLQALQAALSQSTGCPFFTQHNFIFSTLFIGILCLLNFLDLKTIGKLQSSITIFKLIPLVSIALLIFGFWHSDAILPFDHPLSSLQYTLPLALFGFWGFETCANISHRIGGSPSNASRAIMIGFFATVLIYMLVHLSLINIMGAENLALLGVASFVHSIGISSPFIKNAIGLFIRASIIAAYINAIFGSLTSSSFLLGAMARTKLLFPARMLSATNKEGQPIAAVCLLGSMIVLFSWFITQQASLTAIANLGMLGAFVLTLISLGKIEHAERNHRGLLMCCLALAACIVLGVYSYLEISTVMYTVPLICSLALGIILYSIKHIDA